MINNNASKADLKPGEGPIENKNFREREIGRKEGE